MQRLSSIYYHNEYIAKTEPKSGNMLVENECFNAHRSPTNIEKRELAGIGRKETELRVEDWRLWDDGNWETSGTNNRKSEIKPPDEHLNRMKFIKQFLK